MPSVPPCRPGLTGLAEQRAGSGLRLPSQPQRREDTAAFAYGDLERTPVNRNRPPRFRRAGRAQTSLEGSGSPGLAPLCRVLPRREEAAEQRFALLSAAQTGGQESKASVTKGATVLRVTGEVGAPCPGLLGGLPGFLCLGRRAYAAARPLPPSPRASIGHLPGARPRASQMDTGVSTKLRPRSGCRGDSGCAEPRQRRAEDARSCQGQLHKKEPWPPPSTGSTQPGSSTASVALASGQHFSCSQWGSL